MLDSQGKLSWKKTIVKQTAENRFASFPTVSLLKKFTVLSSILVFSMRAQNCCDAKVMLTIAPGVGKWRETVRKKWLFYFEIFLFLTNNQHKILIHSRLKIQAQNGHCSATARRTCLLKRGNLAKRTGLMVLEKWRDERRAQETEKPGSGPYGLEPGWYSYLNDSCKTWSITHHGCGAAEHRQPSSFSCGWW